MGWDDWLPGTILRTAPTPRSQRPLTRRDKPGSGLIRADAEWMAQASCRGLDPNLFHPGPHTDQSEPKAVCAKCPVREQCLDYAIRHREMFGIWGGLNERERKRRLKEQRAA